MGCGHAQVGYGDLWKKVQDTEAVSLAKWRDSPPVVLELYLGS